MYDCSKIHKITVQYASEGPGKYAADSWKILTEEESRAICQIANDSDRSIEAVIKAHSAKPVRSIVINQDVHMMNPSKVKVAAE
ncbi:MAG: hypothetical protein M1468_03230 [Candidatus Thermoplasmatota archaeon]|jgi:hypothetical protein|nr:hypothetical protein [Candidatus Thermoplasmatota archaeon]MCL5441659.1 hypothetical protein [Candidatus Thermoplasmatota archaeon]